MVRKTLLLCFLVLALAATSFAQAPNFAPDSYVYVAPTARHATSVNIFTGLAITNTAFEKLELPSTIGFPGMRPGAIESLVANEISILFVSIAGTTVHTHRRILAPAETIHVDTTHFPQLGNFFEGSIWIESKRPIEGQSIVLQVDTNLKATQIASSPLAVVRQRPQ